MAVTLANTRLTARVRSHDWVRDARGTPVPSAADTITERGPFPCAMLEQASQEWNGRLDPRMNPLRQGDELTDGVRVWTITSVPIFHQVPGCSAVDNIEVKASLNDPVTP